MRTSTVMLVAALVTLPASEIWAQRAAGAPGASFAGPAPMPALRALVYEKLAEAQSCAERDDFACAREMVDAVQARDDLSSYERAQAWNFQAFIDFENDNVPGAIEAYERVLAEDQVPAGMRQQVGYSVAQLYMHQERWDEGLDALDDWQQATNAPPRPEPYVLRSQAHYQRGDHTAGLAAIEEALQLAAATGVEQKEDWYQLMYVHLWNLEDYHGAADVLEEMIRLWPEENHYVLLAAVHGRLGNHVRQLDLLEGAYAAGWLQTRQELITLAGLMLRLDHAEDGLAVLEAGLEQGVIAADEAALGLVDYAASLTDVAGDEEPRASVDVDVLDELLEAASSVE